MIEFFRKGLLLAAATLCLNFVSAPSMATDVYPSKSIKLIVGFPPGGPTDIVGRVIGQQLSKELGQPVVVENNGGAGGLIGASNVAKAKPDGYTLLVSVESSNTRALALNPSVPYDQEKSFTYIRNMAKQRNLVVVNPKLPVSSVSEAHRVSEGASRRGELRRHFRCHITHRRHALRYGQRHQDDVHQLFGRRAARHRYHSGRGPGRLLH